MFRFFFVKYTQTQTLESPIECKGKPNELTFTIYPNTIFVWHIETKLANKTERGRNDPMYEWKLEPLKLIDKIHGIRYVRQTW